MAKLFFTLIAALAIQACITADPNAEDHLEAIEESPREVADPKLDSEPHRIASAASGSEDPKLQGQRQKRFYDYFDFDFTPYGPNNNFLKRDDAQYTSVPGSQNFMLEILRRVQTILSYTRQQALNPSFAPYPVPSFIPFYYVPRVECDCNTGEAPDNGGTQGSVAPPTQPTDQPTNQPTPPIPPADTTMQAVPPEKEPGPASTENTDVTMPDFSTRMDYDDDLEDGSRPISFVPVRPKTPLNRPPPPVEHGTVQASSNNDLQTFANDAPAQAPTRLPPQPQLATNAIPTLCDGAVLTCCHQAEVTYDCFMSQGCPNPSSPDNPCNENLILKVIDKFQYYYANRRG